MADFSPGPWHVRDVDPVDVANVDSVICEVTGPRANKSAAADARLIAAAPEMYELLRLVMTPTYEAGVQTHGEHLRRIRDRAVALLARIDGDADG